MISRGSTPSGLDGCLLDQPWVTPMVIIVKPLQGFEYGYGDYKTNVAIATLINKYLTLV